MGGVGGRDTSSSASMVKMKLSISVATIRPTFWKRLCDSLAQNNVELEVIFVGPIAERPKLSVSCTASHHKLGGIDRRFHGAVWDADLYMHMYSLGGRTHMLPKHTCNEEHGEQPHLFQNACGLDLPLLDSLWPNPPYIDMQRLDVRKRWEDHECVVAEAIA